MTTETLLPPITRLVHGILYGLGAVLALVAAPAYAAGDTLSTAPVVSTRTLDEVVVEATPPPVAIRQDTVEYHAGSFKTAPDATVEDLLRRLPGVEVDADGTIRAQGEQVQQIYVDGKEFFGSNIQATTKNLTADMLLSVQVVDMQTEETRLTGIDDGQRRKVINLKLKPEMRRGYFGNAAAAGGDGRGIDARWDVKGMAGYFRGNLQNALVVNANNTNNAGFGDMGDNILGNSSLRGNRQSGRSGDGLNTSWSAGLNVNYDEGDRLRDSRTPFATGGDALYGGSSQEEASTTHRVNYLQGGNTVSDSRSTGDNRSHNLQLNWKLERTWGDGGRHHLQVTQQLQGNRTHTDDASQSATRYETGGAYISQTQRSSSLRQQGLSLNAGATYTHRQQLERGRRTSSAALTYRTQLTDGDHYTESFTSYDTLHVADLRLSNDTVIDQWQEERSASHNLRLRLTHAEPLRPGHHLELSLTANLSRRDNRQLYHFRDAATGTYADSTGGRTSDDYNSDTRSTTQQYTGSVSYRVRTPLYNLNAGVDLLPQRQHYEDDYDHTRDYTRHYVNYAPRLELRRNWGYRRRDEEPAPRKQNLLVSLRGQTQQPSMNQLQARKNQTSATHVTLGNPDLDPSFTATLRSQFRSFNNTTFATWEVQIDGSATWNALASKRWYSSDLRTDTATTVNLSGISQWSAQLQARGTLPFAEGRWYLTYETQARHGQTEGYANLRSEDSRINRTRTTSASQQAGIAYRSDAVNVELRANYSLQYAEASVVTGASLGTTHRFGGRANVSWDLPWQLRLNTDLTYTARRGYSAGVTRNQTIWNAQLSRTFLPRQNLSAFVKVFDLLHQRSSISRSITATAMTDRETTTLGQYFLAGASIRFKEMGRRGGRGRAGGPRQGRRD